MAFKPMNNPAVDPELEEKIYLQEVAEVKQWWTDSRWRYTKRPFTAEQIVAKRGNLKISYPSNVQAKKLWGILEERYKVCLCFSFLFFGSSLFYPFFSFRSFCLFLD